jgi:heme/copper-type cytochrome/quinol oxidase subunit 2
MTRFLSCTAAAVALSAVTATSAVAAGPWDPLAPAGPQQQQRVTVHIQPAVHGREVVQDPNVAVVPDVPVRLTIVNTSRELHTFTIPNLHVNVMVAAGSPRHPSRTVVTFTAPSVGVFTWYCELCPAVHHQGGMRGRVYALVGA